MAWYNPIDDAAAVGKWGLNQAEKIPVVGSVIKGTVAGFDAAGNPTNTTQLDADTAQSRAMQAQLAQQALNYQPTNAPNLSASTAAGAQIDPSQQAQFRQAQLGLAQSLQGTLNGQTPSIAQQQLSQATQANAAQQASIAASGGHGDNVALALREQAGNTANLNQQAAGQAAQLRAQEITNAQSQLGNVITGARGQDVGLATNQAGLTQGNQQFNAGQQNTVGQANMQAYATNRGQDLTAQNNLANQALNAGQATQGGDVANINTQQQDKDRASKFTGGVLQTIGGVLAPKSGG